MSSDADKVSALTAIYAATRADMSSIMNVSLALLGAGAAYIAGTLSFTDKFGKDVGWIAVILLPGPLWLVAAFHSLLVSLAMSHTVTAQYAERELMVIADIPESHRKFMGLEAGDRIMNITKSRWSHKVVDVIIYLGAALLVIGYTVYMLTAAWPMEPIWSMIFTCIYFGALVSVAFSWTHGQAQVADTNAALLESDG